MIKRILALLAAGAMLFSLAACGGDTSSAPAGDNNSNSTEANGAAAGNEGEPITLNILSATITENPEGVLEQQIADAFMEQNPNVTIEFTGINSNDIYTKIVTLASSNDLPHMFFGAAEWIATFAEMDVMQDLNDLLSKETIDGFMDGVVEECTLNGEFVIFPWFLNPMACIYRLDWFEENELEVPTTWEDFLAVSEALTGDGRWGFSMIGTNNSSGHSRFMAMAKTYGVDIVYEENGQWMTDVGSDAFREAFTYFTDLNNVYGVVPTGISEVGYGEAANYFAMGFTGMMISGPNAIGTATAQNPELEGKIGSFMLPGADVNPYSMLGAQGYVLTQAAQGAELEACIDFLEFLASYDNQVLFCQPTGKLPSTKAGLAADYLQDPAYAGYLAVMEYPYPVPSFAGISAAGGLIGDAYSAVMGGEATIDQALATLEKNMNELLEEYN